LIPFRAGVESLLLTQLIANTGDLLKDSLKGVASIAISGPKQLDLQFSKSYNFAKQYCERPEMLAKLEAGVEKLTGERVKIRLIVQEAPPSGEDADENGNRSPMAHKRVEKRDLAPASDEFLQEALAVFNAQSVRVNVLKVKTEEKKED
jgi:hypothetical protein